MTRSLDVFLHAVGPTGVSRNAVAICERMAAAGWDVRLLCCRVAEGFGAPEGAGLRVLPDWGLPRAVGLARALPVLRAELRARRPDVFLSAGNHAHITAYGASKGLRGKRGGLRTAFRISNDVDHGVPLVRGATSRLLAGAGDLLILVSGALAESPVFAGLMDEGRAHVIRNGVDLARVRAGAGAACPHPWLLEGREEAGRGPVVITLARYAPQKNLGALIGAMARVRARVPARLIVLGGGPEGARARLAARAEGLGIAEAVHFGGAVSNPFAWLSRADAFALPSFYEGASNALLEALACGVPVVASETAGDAPYVLGEGAYGLLHDPRDEGALADAILRQLGSEPVLPGDRAQAFSLAATMDAYEAALTALAERGR